MKLKVGIAPKVYLMLTGSAVQDDSLTKKLIEKVTAWLQDNETWNLQRDGFCVTERRVERCFVKNTLLFDVEIATAKLWDGDLTWIAETKKHEDDIVCLDMEFVMEWDADELFELAIPIE